MPRRPRGRGQRGRDEQRCVAAEAEKARRQARAHSIFTTHSADAHPPGARLSTPVGSQEAALEPQPIGRSSGIAVHRWVSSSRIAAVHHWLRHQGHCLVGIEDATVDREIGDGAGSTGRTEYRTVRL